ncbi:hypothetical protein HMPREF9013_0860 [Bulleidia extructa W1219]|uniref:Uncharacterized protein n=1 Tax=Bulleidia extructa W1219 TaxID=679192 RepID=D2MM83_9FIRM|nr:hypothetical protein HMPREF9013_0860 [Bulleidia extructa W1219]
MLENDLLDLNRSFFDDQNTFIADFEEREDNDIKLFNFNDRAS